MQRKIAFWILYLIQREKMTSQTYLKVHHKIKYEIFFCVGIKWKFFVLHFMVMIRKRLIRKIVLVLSNHLDEIISKKIDVVRKRVARNIDIL